MLLIGALSVRPGGWEVETPSRPKDPIRNLRGRPAERRFPNQVPARHQIPIDCAMPNGTSVTRDFVGEVFDPRLGDMSALWGRVAVPTVPTGQNLEVLSG